MSLTHPERKKSKLVSTAMKIKVLIYHGLIPPIALKETTAAVMDLITLTMADTMLKHQKKVSLIGR